MDIKTIKFHYPQHTITNNISIEIPYLCPHCEVSNNPTNAFLFVKNYVKGKSLLGLLHNCTGCSKNFFTLQMVEDKKGNIISSYPRAKNKAFGELLSGLSPQFIKLYNQAYTAEQLKNTELAGMGYRASLEVLIKDYALDFDLDSKDSIANLSLNNAIGKFFKGEESIISADVVRKLGNGYAHHWDNENDELSLEVLKTYLEIFIKQIEVKLMLKHPPTPTRMPN
ncbi:DUF4145 domain-containing protein [Aquibacillus koreensis]|uniref:DUF4145 domain-containing protein n=1 Tax=Aquibacillus koreensis TaxID=279446 RepID=A0A9X3WLQ0_9BACI|nr:DUF4145 domain-containing protein [Aquibacillus koreensis]MCT2534790.1 DUF4145 domain-containing protein [Aquibacillus koreensis]MDC3419599.1 DUF4145 domain-containing protein [Aquibacillus koreensis]